MTATTHAKPAPPSTTRRPWLAAFAAFNAVAAWAGAVGLISGAIGLTDRLNQRLPFASPVLGGMALAAIVAVPLTVLAWQAWRGDPGAGPMAVVAGGLLVGWIVVQVAFLRELSWFHPAYVIVGLVLIAVGRRTEDRA